MNKNRDAPLLPLLAHQYHPRSTNVCAHRSKKAEETAEAERVGVGECTACRSKASSQRVGQRDSEGKVIHSSIHPSIIQKTGRTRTASNFCTAICLPSTHALFPSVSLCACTLTWLPAFVNTHVTTHPC
mmetsp:Transcript_21497/g.52657  ORF Transcript_21497/g.52657 Transcript_21497/m.52657 type:complete len:129 (-) Transcript_21497:3001-3387(-)